MAALISAACALGSKQKLQTGRPELILAPPSPDPEPPPPPRPGLAFAFTPDGKWAARLRGDELSLFPLQAASPTGQTVGLAVGEAQALALTQERAAFGYPDGKLTLWDVHDKKQILSLNAGPTPIVKLALSEDGSLLLSGDSEGVIQVWDLVSGKQLFTFKEHKGAITALGLTRDKSKAFSGSNDATLKIWDLGTGKLLRTLTGHSRSIWSAAISPDGRYAISTSEDGSVKGWEVSSGRELFTRVETVRAVAIRPDGARVLAVRPKGLALWELASGIELLRLETPLEPPRAASLAAENALAFLFDKDGELKGFTLPDETHPERF